MATALALHPAAARRLQHILPRSPQGAATTRELSGQATVTGPAEVGMLVVVGIAAVGGILLAGRKMGRRARA